MRQRILILTSSMGAGHDGVSHELARRLEPLGFDCHVLDMVEQLPFGTGRMLRRFYAAMIRFTPWLYERIYRTWLEPAPDQSFTMSPVTRLLERKISDWVAENRPVAVVSTFSVTTQTAGTMRRKGTLKVPVANMIVDFAPHGAWVDPGIDLHIVLHERAAEKVRDLLGSPKARVVATGPTVRAEFLEGRWDRLEARISAGLPPEACVVLVAGGSWGSGKVAATVRDVLAAGPYVPLVVCGDNPRLARRARRICGRAGRGVVFGWVDEMWRLMAAADVMLENAGGLTAMEAIASQVPVVSYRPIPGHGLRDVEAMAEAGVSTFAHDRNELADALKRLGVPGDDRETQLVTAAAMFRGDAAVEIAKLAGRPA
jgi:processive 1,2-diacylglycerol beta-glucosyltransferase